MLFCVETLGDFLLFPFQLRMLEWAQAHCVHTWKKDLEFNSRQTWPLCSWALLAWVNPLLLLLHPAHPWLLQTSVLGHRAQSRSLTKFCLSLRRALKAPVAVVCVGWDVTRPLWPCQVSQEPCGEEEGPALCWVLLLRVPPDIRYGEWALLGKLLQFLADHVCLFKIYLHLARVQLGASKLMTGRAVPGIGGGLDGLWWFPRLGGVNWVLSQEMPGPNPASSAAPDLHTSPFLHGLIKNFSTINLKYYFL